MAAQFWNPYRNIKNYGKNDLYSLSDVPHMVSKGWEELNTDQFTEEEGRDRGCHIKHRTDLSYPSSAFLRLSSEDLLSINRSSNFAFCCITSNSSFCSSSAFFSFCL
jgi:hypothetical protein